MAETPKLSVEKALKKLRAADAPKSKNARMSEEIDALDEERKRSRAQRLRLERHQRRSTERDWDRLRSSKHQRAPEIVDASNPVRRILAPPSRLPRAAYWQTAHSRTRNGPGLGGNRGRQLSWERDALSGTHAQSFECEKTWLRNCPWVQYLAAVFSFHLGSARSVLGNNPSAIAKKAAEPVAIAAHPLHRLCS
jgi:hypothetical protein